ncbi:hypothetical protein FRC00_008153 [Tulasnella sp. 408]|nr:hypothetical protein FRC00_008153 [Tulasnella sp. 408]
MLLDLVPDAPKEEYASTLRFLVPYLPLCWEYEPIKRPPISLLRRQVFMFSFEEEAGESVVQTLEELVHLLIPPDRLRILERSELGAGNYGKVVLGILDEASPTAQRRVAVKRLKSEGTRGERVRLAKRLARELNIWAKIQHQNIVELIGYYLDEQYESPLIISALMPHGNVLQYIKLCQPGIKQRLAFVKGITAGLACLHDFDPPICHADLKPANVLIDLHMNAVLCDFGLASFVGGSETSPGLVTSTTIKGSARYMDPELLLLEDCKHSLESDVWAWGCTAFEVLTGSFPYPEASGEPQILLAMIKKQRPGNVHLLDPDNFEEADPKSAFALRFLHSTVPRCWEYEQAHRPSMSKLFSQISNLSSWTVYAASINEDSNSDGPREERTTLEGSENALQQAVNQDEVAQSAGRDDLPTSTVSEHLLEPEQVGLCSSGDADDIDEPDGCRNFKAQHHPKMCNPLFQMSNLSLETVNAAGRNEDIPSSSSRDRTSLPEASQNDSGGLQASGEGAQGASAGPVDVPDDPVLENFLMREEAGSYSSEYADDDDGDRQGKTRPEGSSGSDGRMRDEVDAERVESNTLKAQLLALVAAIDEDTQMRGGQAPHENPIGVEGIRKALGNKWESQLATVLRGIDHHKKNVGTTATPINFEEEQASQDSVGP